MSRENWQKLLEIFTLEKLDEKYSEMYDLIALVNKSIALSKEQDEISKKLQEINKEEN